MVEQITLHQCLGDVDGFLGGLVLVDAVGADGQ
jgi:hypothetical protein